MAAEKDLFSGLLLGVLLVIGSGDAARAALTVDTTLDGDDGECTLDCTLREAVGVALVSEEILLPAGVYSLPLGEVRIDWDLTITGSGARATVVEATTGDRVFWVAAGAEVNMSGLTVRRNPPGAFGGGIQNEGVLNVFESMVEQARQIADRGESDASRELAGWTAWDPFQFVDLCEAASRPGREDAATLREIAQLEWWLLFDFCFHQAFDD